MGRQKVIAGSAVTEGKAIRAGSARVFRGGKVIGESKIESLKRFKDDVREVATGFECGVTLDTFNAFEIGDIIEFFHSEAE
jgi:translation initiation factor IF-2